MLREDIRPLENTDGVTHDLQDLFCKVMQSGTFGSVLSDLSEAELEQVDYLIHEEIDVDERAYPSLTALQMWMRNRIEDITHLHERRHKKRCNLVRELELEMAERGLVKTVYINTPDASLSFGGSLVEKNWYYE